MDGNNGIDPESRGDVDHNAGTLPIRDFVLDSVTPAYRGRLLLSDPYPLFPSRANWDKLVADLNLTRYPDIPAPDFYGERNRLIDFEPYKHSVIDLVADIFGEPEPDTEFDSAALAIIKRHLEAAYAEVAAALPGATGDDSEGDPDAETKAAAGVDDSFDCWS